MRIKHFRFGLVVSMAVMLLGGCLAKIGPAGWHLMFVGFGIMLLTVVMYRQSAPNQRQLAGQYRMGYAPNLKGDRCVS